jgi:sigma-B regulation protein RsbQ
VNITERNNVHTSGSGEVTIIFAHGFGCDQNMWRKLVPAFNTAYHVVTFDLVGSGGSDLSAYNEEKYGDLHGYAADLLEIIDQHARGPVIFVGHSVSAMVGLLATIAAPEKFLAQVMVGPSPCYINDGDYTGGFDRGDIEDLLVTIENNYLGWSSAMAPAIMGAPAQPELGVELTNSFCRTDPNIAKHFARVTFLSDQPADLPRSTTPALILQCTDDIIAPISVGDYLHATLPTSNLVHIENVGHCPHLSAPGQCFDAMHSFLSATVGT